MILYVMIDRYVHFLYEITYKINLTCTLSDNTRKGPLRERF